MPAFSTCAYTLDYIKTPYVSYMSDGTNLYRGGWVKTDGPPAPFVHMWSSSRYDPDGDEAIILIGEQRTERVVKPEITSIPATVCRACWVGTLEDIAAGQWASGTPAVTIGADGWPTDCTGGDCAMCVRSVGLQMDSFITVSGTPVTGSGILRALFNDVPAGYVLSGPTSGPDASPTFKPPSGGGVSVILSGFGIEATNEGSGQWAVQALVGQGLWPQCTTFSKTSQDGVSCYFGTALQPDPTTHVLQFGGYFKFNSPSDTEVIIAQRNATQYGLILQQVSNLLQFCPVTLGGGGTYISVPMPTDGLLHFVEWGLDTSSTSYWISIDGGTRTTGTYGWTPGFVDPMWIGTYSPIGGPGSFWFDGSIQELGVYNRQLTDAERTAFVNNGCGALWSQLPCSVRPAMIDYWSFNEDQGPYKGYFGTHNFNVEYGTPFAEDGVCGWRVGCPTTPPPPPTEVILPTNPSPTTPPSGGINISYPGSGDYLNITLPGPITFPLWSFHPWDGLQALVTFGGASRTFYHLAGQVLQQANIGMVSSAPADGLWAIPILMSRGGLIDTLAVAAGVLDSTMHVRLGIYEALGTPGDQYPGALVADFGDIAITGPASAYTLLSSAALVPGRRYYAAINIDTTNSILAGFNAAGCLPGVGWEITDMTGGSPVCALLATGTTYGALPDPFPAAATEIHTGSGTMLPAVWFHAD